MVKGVSPLVATVLLIAITMAVAAILANWVSTQTQQTLSNLPTCIGGSMNYATSDYPKYDTISGTNYIVGLVQAQYVSLGDFRFELLLTNDEIVTLTPSAIDIPAGRTGTLKAETVYPKALIESVRVTSNCSNVYIDFVPLR